MRDTDGQWVFGPALSLELPIFNQRQGQIARLDAERLASEARLEALAIEVRSDVRRLRGSLFAARFEAEHFQSTIIPLRERITALTQEQYNFMLVDTFDLLAAKRESIAVYREYIDSVRHYWELHARLQQAVGGRLPIGMTPALSMPEPSPLLPSSDSPAMHEHGGH
jgi:cobalt-zinc-cadmium efflux system outer membrane protein